MASRMAVDWSPLSRRAPPLALRSPVAARVTVLPLESFFSLLVHAASGSTATAAMMTAVLRWPLRGFEPDTDDSSLAVYRLAD